MIITVVDVCSVGVLDAEFQSIPGCLRSILACDILGTFWFVKDTSLALDAEVFAQRSEPLQYATVSRERSEADLVESSFEA